MSAPTYLSYKDVRFSKKYPYSYLLGGSPKIDKSNERTKYANFIMYLAPSDISGYNVCPKASAGCIAGCLNTAGRGIYDRTQRARINRTKDYVENRLQFLQRLDFEIGRKYRRYGELTRIRLNGTSDISWNPFIKKMVDKYEGLEFYDYSKVKKRAIESLNIKGYHVTFSKSESNWDECVQVLNAGVNVAVVFRKYFPFKYKGFPVISGDFTDARYLDPKGGYIVALKAKGPAKKDTSGFVVDL